MACGAYALTGLVSAYLPPAVLLPLAALFVLLTAVAVFRHKNGGWVLLPAVCLVSVMVHAVGIWGMQDKFALAGSKQNLVVRVESSEPGYPDGTFDVRLRVLEIEGKSEFYKRSFQVRCRSFPENEVGSILKGSFQLTELPKNQSYYFNLSNGVILEAEAGVLTRIGESRSPKFWLARLNDRMAEGIRKELPREEGAVLSAMSLGNRNALTPEIENAYRWAGVSHLLVVSGLHLALLCSAFLGDRPFKGKHRRLKIIESITLVLFVVVLTGTAPSVRRAGTAVIISYLGLWMFRTSDALTSLGIAALLAGMSGPYAYCDMGLQLSFMATLGVILGSASLKPFREKAQRTGLFRYTLLEKGLSFLLCPIMGTVFTLPVQLAYGMTVSGVSIITNLVVTSLAAPTLVLGFAAGFISLIPGFDFAVKPFALAGGVLTGFLNRTVEYFAGLPFSRLKIPAAFGLCLWLVLVGSVLLLRHLHSRPIWWVCLYLAVLPGILFHALKMDGVVQLTTVGYAENPCLVVSENGKTAAILRGSEGSVHRMEYFLKDRGIRQLDLVIDLRWEPEPIEIPAKEIVCVEELVQNTKQSQKIYDIIFTEYHLKTGSLILLDVCGYKIALTEGACHVAEPIWVDVLLAGDQLPQGVCAKTIAACEQFDWTDETESSVYTAPNGFRQVIRPDGSTLMLGGSYASQ